MAFSFLMFLDHTQRHTTVGRTPLDEWSARRRDLYLTTHNTHNRETSIPRWDSNPRSQQESGRRPTPWTARPLGPAFHSCTDKHFNAVEVVNCLFSSWKYRANPQINKLSIFALLDVVLQAPAAEIFNSRWREGKRRNLIKEENLKIYRWLLPIVIFQQVFLLGLAADIGSLELLYTPLLVLNYSEFYLVLFN